MAMEKPDQLEFGHVRETPKDWEQRFEKINLENLNRQGKVSKKYEIALFICISRIKN